MLDIGQTGTYVLVKQVHTHYARYWSNRYICTCQCCFCMAQCTYCYVCIHCPLLLLVVDQSCHASQYIASIHSLPTSVAGYGPQSPCFMMCNMYTFTAHFCSCLGTMVALYHGVQCIYICYLFVQLITDQTMTNEGAVHVLRSVLTGLHTHGQHDSTQSHLINLALTIYEEMVSHLYVAVVPSM